MKLISYVSCMLLSLLVHGISVAESLSIPSTVKGVSVAPTLVRVYLNDLTGEFESCTTSIKKVAYAFDTTISGNKLMLSAILTAKVSGQKMMHSNG